MDRPKLTCDEYDRFRHNVEHEDELVNHRLTWLLVTQSFLFGSCVAARDAPLVVRGLGILICVFALMSIVGAIRSIAFLRTEVDGRAPVNCPPIVGASRSHAIGLAAPLGIPVVFVLGWILF